MFRQLDAVRGTGNSVPNWKVYFHDYSIAQNLLTEVGNVITKEVTASSEAVLNVDPYDESYYGLTGPVGKGPWPPWAHDFLGFKKVNVTMTSFKNDLANNVLPGFCVIEPQYSNDYDLFDPLHRATVASPPNSNHPGPA